MFDLSGIVLAALESQRRAKSKLTPKQIAQELREREVRALEKLAEAAERESRRRRFLFF